MNSDFFYVRAVNRIRRDISTQINWWIMIFHELLARNLLSVLQQIADH